ncbi:MAG: helix-turn-helix transcriptional regulator, partial [Victivallales bacterium]|nr:helix-turn-helix transcriptional regulator [Victivallales bacterium]
FAGFARLLDFLVTIMRLVESVEPPDMPPRQWIFPLEEILAFLNKNYTRRIALTTLVKMSHLSERSFQVKFKKLTGHTVSGYLLQKRLAKAKANLERNTTDSIQNIAFDCGFEDPNYFIRQFRRAFGFPPDKYRRQVAKPKP